MHVYTRQNVTSFLQRGKNADLSKDLQNIHCPFTSKNLNFLMISVEIYSMQIVLWNIPGLQSDSKWENVEN